jgi:hypothetical protein
MYTWYARAGAQGMVKLKGSLWVRWVLLHAVGALIGIGVVAALMPMLVDWLLDVVALRGIGPFFTFLTLTLFAGATVGAAVSLGQSLLLHRDGPEIERWRWAVVTALATLTVWILAFMPEIIATTLPGIQQSSEHEQLLALIAPFAGFMIGAAVGATQWYIVHRKHALSGFWIVVCAVAGAVVTPAIIAGAAYADTQSSAFGFWIVAVLTGLLTALTSTIMTGAMHLSMLTRRKAREPKFEEKRQ